MQEHALISNTKFMAYTLIDAMHAPRDETAMQSTT